MLSQASVIIRKTNLFHFKMVHEVKWENPNFLINRIVSIAYLQKRQIGINHISLSLLQNDCD